MATAFMKDTDFLNGCESFVGKSKYVKGGYGQLLTSSFLNKHKKDSWFKDKSKQNPSLTNYEYLMQFADQGWYCTDCVCLLKGVLWGFDGNGHTGYVGANGVKDSTDKEFYDMCYDKIDISGGKNLDKLRPGMILYTDTPSGHVGTVWKVNGKNSVVIESAPSTDGTANTPITYQNWKGAGYSPYIIYTQSVNPAPAPVPAQPITVGSIVKIVKGAVYGGSAKGTPVPSEYINKPYTVSKVEVHSGVQEALIKELNSWVPTKYLVVVDPNKIEVGSIVEIISGAVYGGSSYGVKVPSACIGVPYTVSKIETHNNEEEALLKELNSWVALKYLKVYTVSAKYPTKTVTVDNLNVRSGPSTHYTVVKLVHRGTKFTVYETKGEWSRVGKNEWVYSKYIK